jgi:hypothetical protein
LVAPGDNSLRQAGSDAGQARDLAHVCSIQVNALTRKQRAGELRGPSSGGLETIRWSGGAGLELHVAGR